MLPSRIHSKETTDRAEGCASNSDSHSDSDSQTEDLSKTPAQRKSPTIGVQAEQTDKVEAQSQIQALLSRSEDQASSIRADNLTSSSDVNIPGKYTHVNPRSTKKPTFRDSQHQQQQQQQQQQHHSKMMNFPIPEQWLSPIPLNDALDDEMLARNLANSDLFHDRSDAHMMIQDSHTERAVPTFVDLTGKATASMRARGTAAAPLSGPMPNSAKSKQSMGPPLHGRTQTKGSASPKSPSDCKHTPPVAGLHASKSSLCTVGLAPSMSPPAQPSPSRNEPSASHSRLLTATPDSGAIDPGFTAKDVICGRHRLAFNHVGNRRFRVTISVFLQAYQRAPNRIGRSVIIQEVIDSVFAADARFLKCSKGAWVELNDRETRTKVAHALRDAAAVESGQRKRGGTTSRSTQRKNSFSSHEDASDASTADEPSAAAKAVACADAGTDSVMDTDVGADTIEKVEV